MNFVAQFLDVLLELAPWLLLGFGIAGLLHGFVPERWLVRALGGEGGGAVARAALIGLPLPLCSCSVVPVATGLRRRGAGAGPTAAFLVATPETGVDSVSATAALMHPFFVVLRPVAAILTAMVAGIGVALWGGCGATAGAAKPGGGCCKHTAPPASAGSKGLVGGLRYAFGDLMGQVAVYLLPALVITALATTLLPEGSLVGELGPSWVQMLAMLLISAPVYVCATATTPVAAAMLISGIAPAAVVVFLLAGPATNLLTMATVRQLLGGRALGIYLGSVCGMALLIGLGAEWLLGVLEIPPEQFAQLGQSGGHPYGAAWWRWAAAAALMGLLLGHGSQRVAKRWTKASSGAAASPSGSSSRGTSAAAVDAGTAGPKAGDSKA